MIGKLFQETSPSLESQSTPEFNLLLHCTNHHLDPGAETEIKNLLTTALDWKLLLELALRHGVVGLFYQTLQKVGFEAVPLEISRSLLVNVQRSTLHSMILMQELLRLQPLFAAQAIPVIPFKGPLLSTELYQNLGLRKTSDLDLLVPPEYFQQAIELLTRSGYAAVRDWSFLNPGREAAYIRAWHEYSLTNGSICIDLHQTLTPNYFLSQEPSFDQLWRNRQQVLLSGQPIWSFGNEDLLIYLTVHGSKECWRVLKWICDIAQFVQTYPETDWSRVVLKSQTLGSERMLLLGFRLAQLLLRLTVPPEIQQRIMSDPECNALARELALNLLSPDPRISNKFSLKKTLFYFRMMTTTRDRLNCLNCLWKPIHRNLIILFPNNRDESFWNLPSQLHFLYYLLRPFRLMITRLSPARDS
ncbi:MAG: nucleotidyltransferase family protein [Elainella sp. Prado103]|jgi:hypothetical protein|nr:nucleotidyltransferase family protein [Elainella sp. Prado103]